MSRTIRPMTRDDIPLGMALKAQAGWNQTEADWRRFLALEPEGCFVGELDGEQVGTVTTCTFGPVAWIAMLIVDPSVRGRGVGKALMEHALAWLAGRGARTIRLDATHLGQPIYERLGFRADGDVIRYDGQAGPLTAAAGVDQYEDNELEAVATLDRRALGVDRSKLLARLLQDNARWSFVVRQGAELTGYLTLRPGARAWQLGPAVALTEEAGINLLRAGMAACCGERVQLDLPAVNGAVLRVAREAGLQEQRLFVRMTKGAPAAEDLRLIWASSGPEMG